MIHIGPKGSIHPGRFAKRGQAFVDVLPGEAATQRPRILNKKTWMKK
jgi:hypothetical protein